MRAPIRLRGAKAKAFLRAITAGFSEARAIERSGISPIYASLVLRAAGLRSPRKQLSREAGRALRTAILERYYVDGPKKLATEFGTSAQSVRVIASRILPREHKRPRNYFRNFDIPDERKEEYRFLVHRKGFTAAEARGIMGLPEKEKGVAEATP
jgi:hypothetical protein